MGPSLERLWELLESNFPLGGPRRHLRDLLGDETVRGLEGAGILAQRRVADTYPCPGTGGADCPRVVVPMDDGTYAAVCGNDPAECDELELSADDVAHLSVDPEALCAAVDRALQIRGTPEPAFGLVHVYRAGTFIPEPGVRHPVYLVVRCQRRDYSEVLDALRSRHDGSAFAVMVPTDRYVGEDTLRQMAGLGVPVLPLNDVVGLDADSLVALVDPVRYFGGIGGQGPGPAPVADSVVARALVCRGDGKPSWRNLDERGYQELVAAADDYLIFADELTKTVVKGAAGDRASASKVKPAYFRMIHAAVTTRGYFDPNTNNPDDDQVSGKQIFQRARQAFDLKYRDNHGKNAWTLLKSVRVDNRTDYHFSPDSGATFALVFVPNS